MNWPRPTLVSLALPLLLLVLPAGAVTQQGSGEDDRDSAVSLKGAPFHVTVDNRGFKSVIVYAIRGGVPFRLGLVSSRQESQFRVSCGDFMNRKTDFLLRPIAERSHFLRGETVGSCDQKLQIVIYATGPQFATVWLR